MRLALALGEVDVDGMLDRITPEQFVEWIAFYSLEPFGDEWRQAALIAAEAANAGKIALTPHMKTRLRESDLTQPEDYLKGKQLKGWTPQQFEQIAAATWQPSAKSQ